MEETLTGYMRETPGGVAPKCNRGCITRVKVSGDLAKPSKATGCVCLPEGAAATADF